MDRLAERSVEELVFLKYLYCRAQLAKLVNRSQPISISAPTHTPALSRNVKYSKRFLLFTIYLYDYILRESQVNQDIIAANKTHHIAPISIYKTERSLVKSLYASDNR